MIRIPIFLLFASTALAGNATIYSNSQAVSSAQGSGYVDFNSYNATSITITAQANAYGASQQGGGRAYRGHAEAVIGPWRDERTEDPGTDPMGIGASLTITVTKQSDGWYYGGTNLGGGVSVSSAAVVDGENAVGGGTAWADISWVEAPVNTAPTIFWTSAPGTVANGAPYTVTAHGHDADGNLTQVNVWKNGVGFAFAGGGNGTDGDSGNTTSDAGPVVISFTAQAVDAAGATSEIISQVVTISAPPNTAPTITWTSVPGNVAYGAVYSVSAHGHDADGNLTQVNVWKNGAGFAFAGGGNGTDGDSGNPTSDAGPTTITFTAQAVDANGATSEVISQTVTISAPPNSAPTISWTAAPGTVANGASYTISAHGHDADGNLAQVNVWKNGVGFAFAGGGNGTDGDSGNATSDTGPTTVTFTAQAVDAAGAASATISQTVNINAPPNAAPTIAWTSSPGTVASGAGYTVSAHGHDADGNLTQVNVWKNGIGFAFAGGGNGTDGDSGNPTSDTGPATVTFTAQAVDAAGATSSSITQTVIVNAPPVNHAPTIAWTSVPGTVSSGASYTVSAHGHDTDGNLTQVNVWKNGIGFAFAGGGNGTDGDSGNPSADNGPATFTFTAQAVDSGGASSAVISQTVTVNAPPAVSASISVSPTSAGSPGSTTVSWASANATSVLVSGPGLSSTAATGSQLISGLAAGTYIYSINAQGAGGPTTQTAAVTVVPNVTGSMAVTPANIIASGATTLSWTTANATTVSVSGPGVSSGAANGTQTVSGLSPGTYTYTLVAQGSGGPVTSTAVVTVAPAPVVDGSVSASAMAITAPGATTISWTTANATSVSVLGQGVSSSAAGGNLTVTGLVAGDYTYTLTALGYGGPITRTATITVSNPVVPDATLTTSPAVIYSNQSSNLNWTTTGTSFRWVHGYTPGLNGVNLYPVAVSGSAPVSGLSPGVYRFAIEFGPGSSATLISFADLTVLGISQDVTASIVPVGAGSVNGAGSYIQGATVSLTPVADATHVFSSWSGDFSGSADPLTFTVGARNYSVTANFAPKIIPVVVKYRPAARTLLQTDTATASTALVTERP